MKSSLFRAVAASAVALAALAAVAPPSMAAPRRKPAAVRTLPWVETAMQLRDKALTDDTAWNLVEALTTRFGPRPAGQESERRAAAWGAERLKAMGFTNVRIEEFPLVPWVRVSESGEIVGQFPQPLAVHMLGGSNSTPPEGVEADAVIFETLQDLRDAPAGSLNGKIAVVLQAIVRTQDGTGYGYANAIRSQGPEIAMGKGAVAFVMRTLGTDDHRLVNTGSTKRTPTMIPAFAVSPPDAAQMRRIARLGQLRLRLHGQSMAPADGRSQNVVAEIRGRERPDEIIAVGGHLDSWDRGTGAIDDAAGIAITTAAVKLIAQLPVRPKRTLRVVWFGSEELSQPDPTPGLQGGLHYSQDHKDEAPNHVAVSESDFGAGRIWKVGLPAGWQNGLFQRELMRVLAPIGVTFGRDASTASGDFTPMGPLGVPGWNFSQDGSKYFDVHHTPDDTLERIDRDELNQNVAAWAAILWMIADSDVDFRKPAPDYVAPPPR